MSPVKQGRELDSLDTASNSKPQKQPVEVGFNRSSGHVELGSDLRVITTLQKQVDDLLFSRTEPNSLLLHFVPPIVELLFAG